MWQKMVASAKAAGEYGNKLSVSCKRHRNPALIATPEDFNSKTPAGNKLVCNGS